jgi:integrase
MRRYPAGTKFNDYSIVRQAQRGKTYVYVRRWVIYPDGTEKFERLPSEKYAHLRTDWAELERFVIRLNQSLPNEQRTRVKVEIRHAFINDELLSEYLSFLLTQIPTEQNARCEFTYLRDYFLHYFIGKLDIPSPVDWLRRQNVWAQALLNRCEESTPALWERDRIPSAKFLKDIVIAANRFMQWLHERRPSEVPPLRFKPISRAAFKELDARRRVLGQTLEHKYIKDADWARIEKALPDSIRSQICLGYYYGLRRAETLGVKPGDVKKGYLLVERQLKAYPKTGPVYGPPKGRKSRNVPHWMVSAAQAYEWVDDVQKNLMAVKTLYDRFAELMEQLGLSYTLHDLRHTWTTKVIKNRSPRDVQLAAGHEHLNTTMKYIHVGEESIDDEFRPGA